MKILISDLFDGYEESELTLPRAAGITEQALLRRTKRKLPARKKPAVFVVLAAALVALLCGASALVHFVTLRPNATPKGGVGVHFDAAAAVTEAPMVGFRAGWTPECVGELFSTTIADQLNWYTASIPAESTTDAETLSSAYVYLAARVPEDYWLPDSTGNHFYTIYAYPATSLAGAELILPESNGELLQEGPLGSFQAAWVSLYDTDGALSQNALLLCDEASNSVLCVSGGLPFDVLEKIASSLELVVTDIPAPESAQSIQFAGAIG